MAPLRPERSRSSSSGNSRAYPDDVEDLQIPQSQQAGRSAIHLAAQKSARSLREASSPVRRQPSPWSSTPALITPKRRPSFPQISTSVESLRQQDGSNTARRSLSTPSASSPLTSIPSSSGLGPQRRKRSTEGLEGRQDTRFLTVPTAGRSASSPQRPRIKVPTLAPPVMSELNARISRSQLSSPRSVRDLGSDYTRYFDPYVLGNVTRDNLTQQNSSTCLMSGTAGADLSRRWSNPFADVKRLSNPFDSPGDAAHLTPHFRPVLAHDDLHPAIATLAPESRVESPALIQDGTPEKSGFFQYIDDRLGAPEYSFPLITDAKEDDDDMHMPQWDDDILLKPRLKDHFTRENIVSSLGLFIMVIGLLCIFVVLPVVSYTGTTLIDYYETPLDQMPGSGPSDPWAHVNDRKYPLLKNIRHGLIDPDTPEYAKTRTSIDGETLVLVFSDEFNKKNRTFYHGDDPYWFGFEGWYGATKDLEWYDPDAINTGDGTLQLQLDQFVNHDLDFRSGMLNSWNQLCFKGGIFEVSMSLPGPAGKHGLWPGVWTMGNLGRPGYLATTDGLWPYTYSECDSGITSNQSMTDGTSNLPGQRLPSCTCAGEEHPTPGKGRGAPEIDIAEVSADWTGQGLGLATQSFQVAPFDIWYYPNYDFMQTPDYHVSSVNTYTGGPYQQAVSTTTLLNNSWYDGEEYQKYAFEYVPGGDENAFIAWTVGDEETMRFDGRAIGPNGNIGQRLISEEPMSLIMNLGISESWTYVEFADLRFPTVLRIDYVRWYQREVDQMVTCDPPGYETTKYIASHPAAYHNANFTRWEDAGYSRPKNTLVDACTA